MGIISVTWASFMIITLCLPQDAPITINNMNYSPIALGIVLISAFFSWIVSARYWFKGAHRTVKYRTSLTYSPLDCISLKHNRPLHLPYGTSSFIYLNCFLHSQEWFVTLTRRPMQDLRSSMPTVSPAKNCPASSPRTCSRPPPSPVASVSLTVALGSDSANFRWRFPILAYRRSSARTHSVEYPYFRPHPSCPVLNCAVLCCAVVISILLPTTLHYASALCSVVALGRAVPVSKGAVWERL